MALQPWRKAVVTRIEEEADSTRRFYMQVPGLETFDFKPGQFITLDLPIHEKPAKRWRSYSIASWPNGTNELELVIVLLEGGAGTTYLFNEVKPGSELTFRGAARSIHLTGHNRKRPLLHLHRNRHCAFPQHAASHSFE